MKKSLLLCGVALQVANAGSTGFADIDSMRSSYRLDLATPKAAALKPALTKPSSTNKAPQKPNIIVIMADDMGFSDIGCYGGVIDTPNIDQLAKNGIRYTQFYNTARCCPTRAALLTGLYSHQAGVGHMTEDKGYDGYRGDLNSSCVTIAQVMQQAGYGTYMAGKWHVTKNLNPTGNISNWPCQRGFDHFYGTITGAGNFFDPKTLTEDNKRIQAPANYYYTDAISENAVKFIDDHRAQKPETPFFMYVAYTAPHWPLHALEEDITRYKGRFDAGWDELRQQKLDRQIKMGIIDKKWALTPRGADAWADAKNKEWQLRRMEVYAAMVTRMDRGVGKIVEDLKKNGQLDNTMIMFLADNGGCAENLNNQPEVMPGPKNTNQSYGMSWANLSNTPFRLYKHWEHEGGISAPLVVHWPAGIKAHNELREHVTHLIDIMPTCVELSGATYPVEHSGNKITPMEGKSLVLSFANKPLLRDYLCWEHEGNRAIRVGKYKLVALNNKPWELYDMEADRTELNDLSAANPEKVKELSDMWDKWAQRANVLPLNPRIKPKPDAANR